MLCFATALLLITSLCCIAPSLSLWPSKSAMAYCRPAAAATKAGAHGVSISTAVSNPWRSVRCAAFQALPRCSLSLHVRPFSTTRCHNTPIRCVLGTATGGLGDVQVCAHAMRLEHCDWEHCVIGLHCATGYTRHCIRHMQPSPSPSITLSVLRVLMVFPPCATRPHCHCHTSQCCMLHVASHVAPMATSGYQAH